MVAERPDQLGHRYDFCDGFIGIVTVLGADSPEITSAASVLLSGNHELAPGVIFGLNISALFGLSAIISDGLTVTRVKLLLNIGIALCVTLFVGMLTLGWFGAFSAGLLLAIVIAPYVASRNDVGRHPYIGLVAAASDITKNATAF